jgi:anti-sigma B factor antagonist
MGLEISTRHSDDILIVDLRGNLLGTEGERLRDYLRKSIDTPNCKLLLDLTNLRQIDSFGISVVVQVHLSLRRRGGEVKLVAPQGQTLNALMVLHLLDLIPTYENEAEAIGSFPLSNRATSFSGQ